MPPSFIALCALVLASGAAGAAPALPGAAEGPPPAARLALRLTDVEAELAGSRLAYGDGHPDVADATRRRDWLRTKSPEPRLLPPAAQVELCGALAARVVDLLATDAQLALSYGDAHPARRALAARADVYRAALAAVGGAEGCPRRPASYAELAVLAAVAEGRRAFATGRYGDRHPQRMAADAAHGDTRRALAAFGPPGAADQTAARHALRAAVEERTPARGGTHFGEDDYVLDALLAALAAAEAGPVAGEGAAPVR